MRNLGPLGMSKRGGATIEAKAMSKSQTAEVAEGAGVGLAAVTRRLQPVNPDHQDGIYQGMQIYHPEDIERDLGPEVGHRSVRGATHQDEMMNKSSLWGVRIAQSMFTTEGIWAKLGSLMAVMIRDLIVKIKQKQLRVNGHQAQEEHE
jgi:hypothetical protein